MTPWQNFLIYLPWPGERRPRLIPAPASSKSPFTEPIARTLAAGRQVALIYLDVVHFRQIEAVYGKTACQQIISALNRSLAQEVPQLIPPTDVIGVENLNGDDFAVYISTAAAGHELAAWLQRTTRELRDRLVRELRHRPGTNAFREVELHAGWSSIYPSSALSLSSQLYTALKEAMQVAKQEVTVSQAASKEMLKEIIGGKRIRSVYQPIVSLTTGEVFGYEALSRGPQGHPLESPGELFSLAEQAGLLYALETACREKAIATFRPPRPESRLFLNINPQVINDHAFTGGRTRQLLGEAGLVPAGVTLEITERTSVKDFSILRRALEHYRQQGYSIALDDTGAGYSSLQAVAELQPDFIKIDLSIIKDIDRSPVKRALLETFHTFATKVNAPLIAEGVETTAELRVLLEMGIPYAQGFFLARPGFPLPQVNPEVLDLIRQKAAAPGRGSSGLTVGQIALATPTTGPATTTREATRLLEENPQLDSLVVVADGRPVGLLMRDKLYYHLASQYGVSLYWDRPLTGIMDSSPLVVETYLPVETVSQMATSRAVSKLYDEVIVVQDKHYVGTVSVQRLLDTITRSQMELARFANPLTGLPGNPRIEAETSRRLQSGSDFSLVYADLDNFKAFNDKYGFERGDQAITLTAGILTESLNRIDPDGFVGHVGGDDFVLITRPEQAEALAQEIIREFDARVGELYDPADREQGYILSHDRQGHAQRFPLMTISLAMVDNFGHQFSSQLEMAEVAAELKKYAKKQPGSNYVRDKRQRP